MIRLSAIAVLFWVLSIAAAYGAGVDNQLYANVLRKYVADGLVDYAGIKAHRGELDSYLAMMGRVDPAGLSPNDRLAFYINLYNAATLRLIVDHYPVESIKDIGSIFFFSVEKEGDLFEWRSGDAGLH